MNDSDIAFYTQMMSIPNPGYCFYVLKIPKPDIKEIEFKTQRIIVTWDNHLTVKRDIESNSLFHIWLTGISNQPKIRKTKWDIRFLNLAAYISNWSKDPSTKVGCVIVDSLDGSIVSTGFNGFPRGMDDKPERLHDREFKYAHVKHAEENAVFFSTRPLHGCTVYLTQPPCSSCLGMLKQKGIVDVVCLEGSDDFRKRWNTDSVLDLAKELDINITIYPETIREKYEG